MTAPTHEPGHGWGHRAGCLQSATWASASEFRLRGETVNVVLTHPVHGKEAVTEHLAFVSQKLLKL